MCIGKAEFSRVLGQVGMLGHSVESFRRGLCITRGFARHSYGEISEFPLTHVVCFFPKVFRICRCQHMFGYPRFYRSPIGFKSMAIWLKLAEANLGFLRYCIFALF